MSPSNEKNNPQSFSYEDHYDFVPMGFCSLSRDGRLLRANHALAQLLEADRNRLAGRRLGEFVPEERQESWDVFLGEVFEAQTTKECELALETETKERRWAHVRAASDEAGRTCRVVLVDITWRRHLEEDRPSRQADSREQMPMSVQLLAGGIAHNFNNALTGVLGHLELALIEVPKDSSLRKTLDSARRAAEDMAEQTSRLLAYSGKSALRLRRTDFSHLVEEALEGVRFAVPDHIELKVELERLLPPAEVDAAEMHQVVLSLVENAVEAIGGEPGRITIRTGSLLLEQDDLCFEPVGTCGPGTHLFLDVADTGCGMDDETLGKIFEPFFTTKFVGRGLGLPAVMGAVRAHGGFVRAGSEPGQGSRFRVLIPSAEPGRSAEAAEQPAPEPWAAQGWVLFADDELPVRDVAKAMLEHVGFEVITAVDGLEAVKLVKERGKGLVLVVLDVNMPRMDGVRALQEIRRIREDLPVLLTSGYSEREIAGALEGVPMAGFIPKPYHYEDFIARIRKVVGSGAF